MGKLTPQERKARTAELYKFHKGTFKKLKIDDPLYIPKMAHFVKGLSGMHMGFFESELSQGKDIYTERVSITHESEDPTRTLYKIEYNRFFDEEYAKSDLLPGGGYRYFIPLEEMEEVVSAKKSKRIVQKEEPRKTIKPLTDFPVSNEDAPMSEMTIKDHAAITAWKPVSSKSWLNDIIRNNP